MNIRQFVPRKINEPRHGEDGFEFDLQKLNRLFASLKAANSTSLPGATRSTVETRRPMAGGNDPRPRMSSNASVVNSNWAKPGAKVRRIIPALAALALLGYGAAFFTGLASSELTTHGGGLAIDDGRGSKAGSEFEMVSDVKRDLKVALAEISIARKKEAEWMRIFEEDDTKALALSRDLQSAREEIANYIASIENMRSEIASAREAAATAQAKSKELTRAIDLERGKVVSLTRELTSVREEPRGRVGRRLVNRPTKSTVGLFSFGPDE